jgi:hypothetical protein
MLEVVRQILEAALFTKESKTNFVYIPKLENSLNSKRSESGEFEIPHSIFPETCEIVELAPGADYLLDIERLTKKDKPEAVFYVPPFLSPRYLPESLKREHPRWDLSSICLKKIINASIPGTFLGALIPEGLCSSPSACEIRKELSQKANIHYLISLDNSHAIFPGIHSQFKFCIFIIEIGKTNSPPIKFFEIPNNFEEGEGLGIIQDFTRLAKQGGGVTQYGFVYREQIEPGEKLNFQKYHPDLLKRQGEIKEYGGVRKLSEICKIFMGSVHSMNNAKELIPADRKSGVPLIDGRAILADGSLDYENTRYRVKGENIKFLESGDICLRKLVNPGSSLKFSEVTVNMPTLAASDSVLVLKLNPDIIPEDRELILTYLSSDFVTEWLRAQGMSIQISISLLNDLPVPQFDEDLRNAFRSLNEAAKQFEEWKEVAEQARSSLFKFSNAQDSRLYLLTTGREARQRQEAAQLIDDFDYRVRTRLPHPIAYRWRTVKSSYPDLEGYMGVLECAEVAICYLAHMAIVLAQHLDIPINHLKQDMAERLSEKQHGTNFGDWVTILRQVRDSKQFRALTGHIPFYEVLKFLEPQADKALQQLSKRRNDQAHNRGPKGAQVSQAYDEALKTLEILLKSAEFVSEYPLRYIEDTKRDSIKKVTNYSYRDLMGDHPLVPIKTAQTTDPELEASSLYLVDRDGKLYLLRPLLSRRQCPECGTWATFYLDSYKKSGDSVLLKSMEHGHSALDPSVAPIFRDWGVLKETF